MATDKIAPKCPGPSRHRCRSVKRSPSASITRAHALGHAAVGIHVEQDRAGVADQRVGPGGDDDRADDADERVHEGPAEIPSEREPDDDQERNRRVGQHVNDGGAHVVVAVRGGVRVLVFGELDVVDLAASERHARGERVRLRDLVERFQVAAARGHGEGLACAARAHRLDG